MTLAFAYKKFYPKIIISVKTVLGEERNRRCTLPEFSSMIGNEIVMDYLLLSSPPSISSCWFPAVKNIQEVSIKSKILSLT